MATLGRVKADSALLVPVAAQLDEGADLTLKNGAGMTALDFARAGDFRDIVEGLTYRLKKAGKL